MRRASLIGLLVPIACSGCTASFDGETPIHRNRDSWQEIGGGEGGVLLRQPDGRVRLTTSEGVRGLETTVSLKNARVQGNELFVLDGGDLVAHEIEGDRLSRSRVVAHVDRATLFALEGDSLAIARPSLVVAGKAGALRGIWEGEAAALAIDPRRGLVWIAGRRPLPVIDCVREADGKVLLRVALPRELDSPGLRIVLSGEDAAVYALDRPVAHALRVSPRLGAAVPLLATKVAELAGGACDDGSVPLLLVPPPFLAPDPTREPLGLGRIAPFPGDRFLVIDGNVDGGKLELALVGAQNDSHIPAVRGTELVEGDWQSRPIEGVAWDETGVVLTSADERIALKPGASPDVIELHPALTVLREGTNQLLNVIILGVDIVGCSTLVVAAVGLVVGLAPIWIPLAVALK